MGVSIGAQEDGDSEYVTTVRKTCQLTQSRHFSLIKQFDFTYQFTNDYKTEMKYIDFLHSHTTSVINERRRALKESDKTSLTERDDDDFGRKKKIAFLDLLLTTEIDGVPLSNDDIREEVDTFMFAGHDTTTTAKSFALYLLSTHSEIQEKAFEEQRRIFNGKNQDATFKDLQDMKYLELVIKENLRLYPPTPIIGRKIVDDVEFEGHILPAGTTIAISSFNLHRNPDFYPDPEKFNPSRFENIDGKKPYAFIPFSAGPRNCIGQKFAMIELKSTLSKIIRNFEILPVAGYKPKLSMEQILKPANGIHIILKRRSWS